MRNIKIVATIVFTALVLAVPRAINAQENMVTTLQVAPGCTIAKQTFPRTASTKIQPLSNGVIITTWTERGAQNPAWGNAEVKTWMDSGQPVWTIYDSTITTWTSSNCTKNQMYAEYQRNQLPAKSWNDLCTAKMTCPPPTTGPTPTPGSNNGICQILETESLQRGNHTVPQVSSGKMLLLWTDRGANQNPAWGNKEVKVWMPPGGQPDWKIYDAGGMILYSKTCNFDQMYQRFKQENKQEVTWDQLCKAGITCPPKTTTPTPPPNPSGTPAPGGICQNMQATTLTTGNHTLPVPNANGAILTVWSGKPGVPWGGVEKKTWINPGEQWKLFTSGGTLWTTNACNRDQVRARFAQIQFEEKTWQQLCDAKITCQ